MKRICTSLGGLKRRRVCSLLVSMLATSMLLLITLKHSYPILPGADLENVQTFRTYNIDCSAIYNMDPVEVGKSLVVRRRNVAEEKDERVGQLMSNCSLFVRSRGYGAVRVSEVEKDFPLAYSLVVHKSAWMVERIIRAVYSPNNIYCVHYDQKASRGFISAIEGLARCLPNVFVASKRESVTYAHISRLKADLNCLSDLLASEVQWKYVINLCGQDFPLKTNAELLSELRGLRGANMLETSRPTKMKRERFAFHHERGQALNRPFKTKQAKSPPPHDIEMFVGNAYFVLSREFITYVSSASLVRDFLAWSEDTYSPDEHFWATLVRVPGAPGGVPRSHPDITDLMSKTRLVKWHYLEEHLYPPCSGTHVRSVCIFGAAELHWLLNYGHWFANKLDPQVDGVLIQCLEEKLEEKRKLPQGSSSQNFRWN